MSGDAGLPIGTVVGELEIRAPIGRGGFGLVYAALDPGLAIEVALKEYFLFGYSRREGLNVVPIDDNAAPVFEAGKARFIREARLLAMLHERAVGRTESLVSVHRVFQAHNTAYMVMRLYRGQTLRWHLKQKGDQLTQAWLIGVMLHVLDALESLHALPGESLVHRDVSPENIIILPSDIPVLLDFGAARDSRQAMTAVIYRVGYSPIELYTDVHPSGPWTDLYSLCAIAYFAVGHVLPLEAFDRLAGKKMPLATELGAGRFSQAFLRVIDKGMQVLPQDRYGSAAELRQALRDADAGRGEPDPAPASPEMADPDATRVELPSRFSGHDAVPTVATVPLTTARSERPAESPLGEPGPSTVAARRPLGVWVAAAAVILAAAAAAGFWLKADRPSSPSALPNEPSRPQSPALAAASAPAGLPGLPCARADARWGCVLEGLARTSQAPSGSSFALPKPSAQVGDAIDAVIASETGGFVHLFSVDDTPQGQLTAVFPNEFDSGNQIGPGAKMTLPRRPLWDLQAQPPRGNSWFVVVVTSQRVPAWRSPAMTPVTLQQALAGFEASDPWAALGLPGCALSAEPCNLVRAVIPMRFEVR